MLCLSFMRRSRVRCLYTSQCHGHSTVGTRAASNPQLSPHHCIFPPPSSLEVSSSHCAEPDCEHRSLTIIWSIVHALRNGADPVMESGCPLTCPTLSPLRASDQLLGRRCPDLCSKSPLCPSHGNLTAVPGPKPSVSSVFPTLSPSSPKGGQTSYSRRVV